jgi:hypothetical protein
LIPLTIVVIQCDPASNDFPYEKGVTGGYVGGDVCGNGGNAVNGETKIFVSPG